MVERHGGGDLFPLRQAGFDVVAIVAIQFLRRAVFRMTEADFESLG